MTLKVIAGWKPVDNSTHTELITRLSVLVNLTRFVGRVRLGGWPLETSSVPNNCLMPLGVSKRKRAATQAEQLL